MILKDGSPEEMQEEFRESNRSTEAIYAQPSKTELKTSKYIKAEDNSHSSVLTFKWVEKGNG